MVKKEYQFANVDEYIRYWKRKWRNRCLRREMKSKHDHRYDQHLGSVNATIDATCWEPQSDVELFNRRCVLLRRALRSNGFNKNWDLMFYNATKSQTA